MPDKPNIPIGVAVSGGVDSTVAAALLLEQGYTVHGFFMLLPVPGLEQQKEQVRRVATALGIPLHLLDLRQEFTDSVIRYFLDAYRAGVTPNPCIYCNRFIKFGQLLDAMHAKGMQQTASGHYARIIVSNGQPRICRSLDSGKDQSYFLCRLRSRQLRNHLFPLAGWAKEHTYRKASSLGFRFADGESQDVCFLAQGLSTFLAEHGLKGRSGDIVTTAGIPVGRHRGIFHYTVGQRRGLGIPDATPWYVTGIDTHSNRLIVGKNETLLRPMMKVHSLQWQYRPTLFPWRGMVQIRSRHAPVRARLTPLGQTRGSVYFSLPQRAVTPGQFAAFYEGDKLIGSGIIEA